MRQRLTRREFLAASSTTGAAVLAGSPPSLRGAGNLMRGAAAPALLGGEPVRRKPFSAWPIWREAGENSVMEVLRSGSWSRSRMVAEAEKLFARMMGAPYCVATANGTNAIITALRALRIGAGDEVITTPYTFAATIHPILLANALPVFADIDPETWQIDPSKIESRLTANTAAILPVHIIGGVCDMDRINAVARRRSLRVVEDACEAHFGEWKGRKVGTLGDLGCFSFQTGKALTCGEGGAILGHDEQLMEICYSFHNLGRPHGKSMSRAQGGHPILASKCRMAEYQAAILMTQMESVLAQVEQRSKNADYLSSRLRQIPGIQPRRDYPDVTRTAFYYYGFRYKREMFDGLDRDRFLAALNAEGIPSSKGLGVIEGRPMNREGFLDDAFGSKTYRRLYPGLKLADYQAGNVCPESDRLCQETAGFHQRMLLGSREDMDDICNAVQKVYENRGRLARA